MKKLEMAARLLGVAPDALKAFPENVQNAMDTVMDMMEIHDLESAMAAYDELEKIWRNAIREEMLHEVSDAAHLPETMLDALPEALRNRVFLNYAASGDLEKAVEEEQNVCRPRRKVCMKNHSRSKNSSAISICARSLKLMLWIRLAGCPI